MAAAYAVVAWLLLQAADILLDNFGAPDWVFKSFATGVQEDVLTFLSRVPRPVSAAGARAQTGPAARL